MCNGKVPYRGNQVSIDKQINRRDRLLFKDGLSSEYKSLVESLLVIDPENRMALIDVFDHPFILKFQKQFNITKLDTDNSNPIQTVDDENNVYAEVDEISRQIKELQDRID